MGSSVTERRGPWLSFQGNAGLPVDPIVGGATLRELIRLESRHDQPQLVSSVRAHALLRDATPTLTGRHVAVGESGGLGSVTAALRRRLLPSGTFVTQLHHPDDSTQALQANELGVDVYLGLRLNPTASVCSTSYWSGYRDQSQGGKLLAELVQRERARGPWRHRRRFIWDVIAHLRGRPGCLQYSLRLDQLPSSSKAPHASPPLSSALGEWVDASWD